MRLKLEFKFLSIIFFLIKFAESSSLTFMLQNNSKNFNSTFECNSTNFNHQNFNTNFSTQIIFFKFCNPLAIFTNQTFLSFVENSKFISVLIFEINLRVKNFTSTEITKIDSIFSKKLKRPILVNIHSSASDIEILYEITEGRLGDASSVSDFLSKINNETLQSDVISDAIKKNCALCLRIAKILDEKYLINLKLDGDDGKCDIDCIRAILNLPHDEKLEEIRENVFIIFHQFYIAKLKVFTNFVTEEVAAENEFKSNLEDLASMSWKNKEFKIFDFLIRADFKFPQNFLNDREKNFKSRNKFVEKVENYIEKVEKFHENIKSGNVENVREFLNSHKFLRFARNLENKSALQVAFDAQQFEILSLLKSHGMSVSDIAELATQKSKLKNLSEENKLKIRQFNHDHLIDIEENFISKLIHRTSIYFDPKFYEEDKLVKIIREALMEVNQSFPEVLEISSKSKNVEIVFNFESNQVDDFDPSGDAVGLTSRQRSFIFIGAEDLLSSDIDEKNYVLGTIAHEFMHFAMFLMYDNDANPYDKDDLNTTNWFMNVTEKCEAKKDEESSIENAFGYKDVEGDGKVYHTELIARIPDIILTYKNNLTHLEKVKESFNELFEFYDQKILPDLRKMIPKMEVKEIVREFNQWFNVLEELERHVVKVCGKIIENDEISQIKKVMKNLNLNSSLDIHAITSNSITLTLRKIQQETKKEEIATIFTKLSFADFENFIKVLYDIDNLKTEMIFVILCDDFDHFLRFKNMIDESSIEHVIFVAEKNGKEFLEFYLDDVQTLDFTFKDLCEESQNIFMKFQINFQGSEIFLEDFVEGVDKEIFELFEIEDLIKNIPEIGVELDANENYLIKLKIDDGNSKDLEEFVEEIYKNEIKNLRNENLKSSEENNFENSSENEIENDVVAKKSKGQKKNLEIIKNSSKIFNKSKNIQILNSSSLHQNLSTMSSNNLNNLTTDSSINFEFMKPSNFDHQISQNSTILIQETNLNFERIFKKSNSEIFILSSKSGSGKSLAMKAIALNIKKASPSKWVIFIDLEEFVDLNDENFNNSTLSTKVSSLGTEVLDLNSSLNLKNFNSHSNRRCKIQKPNSNLKCKLTTYKKSKNSEFNSKISNFKQTLSNLEQKTSKFESSLKLNQSLNSKFSKNLEDDEIISFLTQNENEERIKFLTKYLEHPQKIAILFDNFDKAENPENVLNLIEKCQKFSSQIWISTRPHQEKLLTKKFKSSKVIKISPLNHKNRETFLEYFSHLNEVEEKNLMKFVEGIEVDEIQLLSEIVENWSENYYEMFSKILGNRYKKAKVENFDEFEENLSFKLRLHKEHQKISLKFLDLKNISNLKIMKENFNIKSEEILNFGIVQKNKKFTAIFQQFYVAQFLIESLTKNETEKIVENLLIEILKLNNEEKSEMIARFLKDFIELHKNKRKIEKIQEIINKNE